MQNEKFKRAIAAALINEYENSVPQAIEHEFSPEFEKKMNRLIRRQKKPYYKLINTAAKRVACIAVCIAAASSAAIMSSSALRNSVVDFFVDILPDHSVVAPVESDNEAPETIEEIYELTHDLSSYEVYYESQDEISRHVIYNKDNIVIDFSQWVKSEYNIYWNSEGAEIETVTLNNGEAIYFINNQNQHTLIWENYNYIFSLNSNIGKNELIEMANSLQKAK